MPWRLQSLDQLSGDERRAWDSYQRSNPLLDSPYFRIEWCDALAAVGRSIEVGCWSSHASAVPSVFLAFERDGRSGYPTGRRVNDYQGLIAAPGTTLPDLSGLLPVAGLRSLHFDHAVADQAPFEPYVVERDCSPFVDLSQGFDEYFKSLSKSGASEAKTARRKGRKLEREVGPLKLTWASSDPCDLESLFRWKTRQYVETGVPDVFAAEWTRQLLRHLQLSGSPEFAGMLNTLHAGDQLVAVHFGLRCQHVLHWWFPTYDPEFGAYSPGRVLLQMLIDNAFEAGFTKFDFGKGMSPYKQRASSNATPLVEGVVENAPVRRLVRQSARSAKTWLKKTPMREPLAIPARWLHHYVSRRAMQ